MLKIREFEAQMSEDLRDYRDYWNEGDVQKLSGRRTGAGSYEYTHPDNGQVSTHNYSRDKITKTGVRYWF